MQSVFSE